MINIDKSSSQSARIGARWGQERRLEFIDYRLQWDGHFNRSDLTNFFGISVPQASLDVAEYLKRASDNLSYDTSTKAYRASACFRAIFESSSLERYLEDLLRVGSNTESINGSFLGWYPSISVVPRPSRRLDISTVLCVIKAIREHEALTIKYQSFSTPTPQSRKITPHTLVNTGFRWHMRAYCHTNNDFRDFLLSRVLQVEGNVTDNCRINADEAWHKKISLVLVPHPDLKPGHKKVIELDYGMIQGESKFECRQALLFYVLQQLGLNQQESSKPAIAQQIILNNWDEISEFLPKTNLR